MEQKRPLKDATNIKKMWLILNDVTQKWWSMYQIVSGL